MQQSSPAAFRKVLLPDALRQPQTQHDPLLRGIGFLVRQDLLLTECLQKTVQIRGHRIPSAVEAGMRRRADADVIHALPVFQIMPAFKAGAGKVGDLILPEPMLLQAFRHLYIQQRRCIPIGHLAAHCLMSKGVPGSILSR